MSTSAFDTFDAAATAIRRLRAFADLDPAALDQLRLAALDARTLTARREIDAARAPAHQPRILLAGWAYRYHLLRDGRRQVLDILLPGDLIRGAGLGRHGSANLVAVTKLAICPAPSESTSPDLARAYQASAACAEHYLLRQITRLGRLSAYERLCDLLLELRDRLAVAGLAAPDRFAMPLTQELLADLLGLTSVHINRTLQALRRDGLLSLQGGRVILPDVARLEGVVEHRPPPAGDPGPAARS